MRTLISTLIILALAAPAFAVLDPDPDQIGFYFDFDAEINTFDAASSVPYFVYVILTNPTAPVVNGFEFGYQLSYPQGMQTLIFQLATTGEPDWNTTNTAVEGEEQDWFVTPLVTTEATILLTWQYMILGEFPIYYHVTPTTYGGDGHPVYYHTDAGPVPMDPVSGSFDAPVASVNGDPVVATDQATFGTLKALYR